MHSLDITCCFLGHFWRTTSAYAGDPGVPFSVLVGLLETGMNFMNVNKKRFPKKICVVYYTTWFVSDTKIRHHKQGEF